MTERQVKIISREFKAFQPWSVLICDSCCPFKEKKLKWWCFGPYYGWILIMWLFFCLLSWHLICQYECFVLIENIFFTQESHCEHFCLNLRPSRVVVIIPFSNILTGRRRRHLWISLHGLYFLNERQKIWQQFLNFDDFSYSNKSH